MDNYAIETKNGQAVITTPYNKRFINRIKNLGGRWDGSHWTVNEKLIEKAREIMRDVYGRDDNPPAELVDVEITFHETYDKCCAPIVIFGRPVIIARGRDSGAHVGENVELVAGHIHSAGSMANWETVAEAGTVIRVYNVPKLAADNEDDGMYYSVTVINNEVNVDALRAERERLMTRVAEIDAILNV